MDGWSRKSESESERERERGWRARNSANPARVCFSKDKGGVLEEGGGGGGVRRDERWKYRVIDAGLISISVSADWLDGPVNQPIFHAYWSCPVQCCRHRRPPVSKNRTVSPVNLCPICAPPLSTPLLPALFSGIIREIKLTDIYTYTILVYSFILNFEYG